MTNKFVAKTRPDFYCELCDYTCKKKSDFNKHLVTTKHKILINPNKKVATPFVCTCGKTYKHASSLCSHKRKCDYESLHSVGSIVQEKSIEASDDIQYKEMFLQMVKQNQEMQKSMMIQNKELQQTMQTTIQEMIPNIGNNNNNKTNNINLQIFLNEECKDALNIMDFVNSLKLQLKDLENTGKMGFVEGTSKIMIDGLKELEIHKRPVHCSDLQNEVLYVKDNEVEGDETITMTLVPGKDSFGKTLPSISTTATITDS